MYRYILRESCSQFDLLPLTSLTMPQAFREVTAPAERRFRITVHVAEDAALAMAIEFGCLEVRTGTRPGSEGDCEEEMNASWAIDADDDDDEEEEEAASDDSFICDSDEDDETGGGDGAGADGGGGGDSSSGSSSSSSDGDDDDDEDPAAGAGRAPFGSGSAGASESGSRDACAACGDGGEVAMCDGPGCARVYHARCVARPSASGRMLDEGDSDR